MEVSDSKSDRLEAYSRRHPQEVLIVKLELEGEPDEVLFYKGIASSLMRPTAVAIDVPVMPQNATILEIDRFKGPFNPSDPQPIQLGMSWAEFQALWEQD